MSIDESLFADVNLLLRLTSRIDRMYANNEINSLHYLKNLRRLVDRFNNKYDGIRLVVSKNMVSIKLKFYLQTASAKEVLSNLAGFDDNELLMLRNDLNHDSVEIVYRNESFTKKTSPEMMALVKFASVRFPIDLKDLGEFCFNTDDTEERGLGYKQKDMNHEMAY